MSPAPTKSRPNKKVVRAFCQCVCGKTTTVIPAQLIKGHVKSCGCSKRKLVPGQRSFNRFLEGYKNNAKQRNLFFDISKKEFKSLISKNCVYCGAVPKQYNPFLNKKGERRLRSGNSSLEWLEQQYIEVNGIDRIDSSKGYELENIVTCCGQCNMMKMDYSLEEFLKQVEKISMFRKGK